jgi:hypothetical protein
MAEKIKILDKEYVLSPLRLKYLRRINDTLKETPTASMAVLLDRYSPYIAASIETLNPGFQTELLEELTFEEFLGAWQTTLKVSGIVIQKKEGELQPSTTVSTGAASTVDSVSPLAGTTVQ